MSKIKALVFPDPSMLYHLLSRTAAADFRNGVRDDVIQLGGEFLQDEFNPHEFFPPSSMNTILNHKPDVLRGGFRVLGHVTAPTGDAADVEFTLPTLDILRAAKLELGGFS